MRELSGYLQPNFLFAIAGAWVAFWLLLSLLVRHARGEHVFAQTPEELQFSEKWTSGRSLKTWWSGLGGARNCLFVGVGRDTVYIHPHFPFSLGFIPEIYGLDLEIPRARIIRVEKTEKFLRHIVRVEYSDVAGASRTFELTLRNADQFVSAIHGHDRAAL
jgi:hypothetical protein